MENKVNINIAVESLRQKLVQDINSSGLPISMLYLIVKELQWNTEKTYYAELNSLANSFNAEEEKPNDETKQEESA